MPREYRIEITFSGAHTIFIEADSHDEAFEAAEEAMYYEQLDTTDAYLEVGEIRPEDPYCFRGLCFSFGDGPIYVTGITNKAHQQALVDMIVRELLQVNESLGLQKENILTYKDNPGFLRSGEEYLKISETTYGDVIIESAKKPPAWRNQISAETLKPKLETIQPVEEV